MKPFYEGIGVLAPPKTCNTGEVAKAATSGTQRTAGTSAVL